MKLWISFAITIFTVAGAFAADLTANPASLDFGIIRQGQSKTLTFALKNTTGHRMSAELTTNGLFTVSPATPTLTEGQQITISVTLPATAAAGAYTRKVRIKGSRLGLLPSDQGEVALVVSVVTNPDFTIEAKDNGNSAGLKLRTISVHLICRSTEPQPTTVRTQVFVTLDNGPEQKMMDTNFVYAGTGQINPYTQQITTSVRTMKVRAVADPGNTVGEFNENNNQSILILNF